MIRERYELAKQEYEKFGIDVDRVLEKLKDVKISIHCWQGDDVGGFENSSEALSGGIGVTGNYPGKARNFQELTADLEKALSLIPGKHKVNLHAIYGDFSEKADRDMIEPKHFKGWVDWAKKNGLGLDFNPTLFSHENSKDGLTLSHPKKEIREFWIEHCKRSRKIGEYFGKELNQTCLTNIWIPDGYKDIPGDRLEPRKRLKNSLDEIFEEKIDKKYNLDAVESKVFGIGAESYTVGSHEFYLNYANQNDKICLLDNGHFHPTESVADKLSSMYLYFDKVALHVTRAVRWDSDHVVILNDELKDIADEIIRNDALEKTIIGLDYFDASINRVAAWVIGTRNTQKALLNSMLTPQKRLKELQESMNYTERLVLMEELKTYPLGDIWNYFCEINSVPVKEQWLKEVKIYEEKTLKERV